MPGESRGRSGCPGLCESASAELWKQSLRSNTQRRKRLNGVAIKRGYELGQSDTDSQPLVFGFRMLKNPLGVPDGQQGPTYNLHRQRPPVAAGSHVARRMKAEGGVGSSCALANSHQGLSADRPL